MKRDLDLIRAILVAIEEKDTAVPESLSIEGYDDDNVAFHVVLLKEAGLVDAITDSDESGEAIFTFPSRLTWEGYEFLDLARNESVWKKAKMFLKDKGASVSMTVLTELLKSLLKNMLGL